MGNPLSIRLSSGIYVSALIKKEGNEMGKHESRKNKPILLVGNVSIDYLRASQKMMISLMSTSLEVKKRRRNVHYMLR